MRQLLAALLITFPLVGFAAQPDNLQPLPTTPPAPGGATDDSTEPQVTIKQKGTSKVEEYRLNGRLYMIKVTPSTGKPYYLIDSRGDGQFSRQDSIGPRVQPPMWVIHRW